jgi:hypothetical protein
MPVDNPVIMKASFVRIRARVLYMLIFIGMGCSRADLPFIDALSGPSARLFADGNSLYHKGDVNDMKQGRLYVEGEVSKSGKVSLRRQFKREVVIKEAVPDDMGMMQFYGAYLYRGYSLFDILHPFQQKKKNEEAFRPAIDLYIQVFNDKGESVVFSWAEIFHTTIPHQVIIATSMSPIEPYRQEVDYPVSDTWRLVSAGDLFAFRHLENPSRIVVRSFDQKDYFIDRDMEPMFSPEVKVVLGQETLMLIHSENEQSERMSYQTHFYGLGMGYHPVPDFEGPVLASILDKKMDLSESQWNRHGLVCFAGLDGYRAVFSFSELFNRADQIRPILAVVDPEEDGGYYRLFDPSKFYADYSVKSLAEIFFFKP